MKRLISCAVTFVLAFSLLGIPGLSFASVASGNDGQTSSYSAKSSPEGSGDNDSGEYKAPESDPTINVDDLKDENGNISQITGSAQLFETETASDDEEESPFWVDRDAIEAELLNNEIAPLALTGGNEIKGSLLTVTLHTYKKTPNATDLRASLSGQNAAGGSESFTTRFVAENDEGTMFVANLTQNDRIPAGTYELRVEGGDYVPYSHRLNVDNGNRMNVVLGDNQEDIFLQSYGLIPYGDFNGDGAVTNADVAILASAVSSDNNDTKYDIDGNNVVDISDLQLFAVSLKEGSANRGTGDSLIDGALGPENTRKDASNTAISPAGGITLAVARETTNADGEVQVEEWTEGDKDFDRLLHAALLENKDTTVVLGTGTDIPISQNNTVSIEIATTPASGGDTVIPMEGMTISYPTVTAVEGSSGPSAGVIQVDGVDENDVASTIKVPFGSISTQGIEAALDTALRSFSDEALAEGAQAQIDESNGLITVDFGTRIAVKKITIVITETTEKDAKLVEIGTVEFLNGMEDLIAPPQLNIPKNIVATPGAKLIDVKWDQEANVSGYEIRFQKGGKTVSQTTFNPQFTLKEWPYSQMKDVKAGIYQISIRSISGEWSSPWSDIVECEVLTTEKPKRPSAITVKSGFKELIVSWPAVEDALWYNLYYKKNVAGESFQKYPMDITTTTITLMGLEAGTEYVLYLTASNNIGTSAASDQRVGTTYGEVPVKVPWYNLVNRQAQYPNDPSKGATITKVSISDGANSDKTFDPASMVDGLYDTYYRFKNQNGGVTLELDNEYPINCVAITSSLTSGYGASGLASARVDLYDASGTKTSYGPSKTDVGAGAPNTYYLTFPTSNVKKINIQQGRSYTYPVSIAEIALYKDDGIASAIADLWLDDVRTTLQPGVTEADIAAIETKVNTPDPECGETTPKKALYLQELADARNVLNGLTDFRQPRYYDSTVDNSISRNVNGINGWQPLGIAGYEGEQLEVFVGGINRSNGQRVAQGANTALKLWICQYNSESENVVKELFATLKIGANSVTVPNNLSSLNAEHGGQIYVEYASSSKTFEYGVRVLGGTDIATLDLHNITGTAEQVAAERLTRIKAYIDELDEYCGDKDARHAVHSDVFANYGDSTCIANTTDILMDDMMYSVPASKIRSGMGSGTVDARAEKLDASLQSMEFLMKLYYQHKGLTNNAGGVTAYGNTNGIPKGHLNIRCMRMKEGVFMYAAGNHIGIPFGSTNLSANGGFTYDNMGKRTSGKLFGWGVCHEIGHDINQGAYTIPEVTNNYYAQLATNVNGSATSRYQNQTLYNKVTSGIYANLSGKTGIGCYWQLHLAYDNYYNFKTFDTYAEQMQNLFFARVDAYARNPSAAPTGTSKKISLSVSGSINDKLARLSCAAAQKDLTDFFDAWGLTLNAETKEYASQFEKETRPIQYVSDEAQDFRIQGGAAAAQSANVTAKAFVNGTEVTAPTKVEKRAIQLKISQAGAAPNDLIGYEILRNGKAVAFQQIAGNANIDEDGVLTYTDTIATSNNRTFVYSVRVVDKLLNVSNTITLPEIKVSDDGTIADKTRWTATTNMTSKDDTKWAYNPDSEDSYQSDTPMPCEQDVQVAAIDKVIDGDADTGYVGELPENGSVTNSEGVAIDNTAPYIEVTLGEEKSITALKVPTADADTVRASRISVSTDGENWTDIPANTEKVDADGGTTTFYFDEDDDPQLKIYKASTLRLTGSMDADKSGAMTLHEIDLLGVTGDNVDFLATGAVGTLENTITYADESGTDADGNSLKGEYTIPAGTMIFLGEYKGDTAYNALKMFDQDGDLVPGTQVFFADVPTGDRFLGDTADGRWIWYMTADDIAQYKKNKEAHGYAGDLFSSIKLTLYRVDDAMTLANERAVADTMTLAMTEELPNIKLQITGDYNDFKAGDEIKQGN